MSRFSVQEDRLMLEGDLGFRALLEDRFEEALAVGGLASSARAFLATAIRCVLAGLPAVAEQLARKAMMWSEEAISREERPARYFPDATEASRYRTLALARWLADGAHDRESLGLYADRQQRYLSESGGARDKASVRLSLPGFLDAERFETALRLISESRLVRPTTKAAAEEAVLASALCRVGLGNVIEERELAETADECIRAHIHRWLAGGHAFRVGEWSKILYWRAGQQPASALEKIRTYL